MKISKRNIFILISTFVFLVFILSTALITRANNLIVFENTKNCQSVLINNSLSLSSFKENSINLQSITDDSINYTFNLENKVDLVKYSDVGFCAIEFISNTKEQCDFIINTAKFEDTTCKIGNLSFPFYFNDRDFVVDNNLHLYIADCYNGKDIYIFTPNGDISGKITADETVNQLLFFNNKVFVFCKDNVYFIENNNLKPVSTTDVIEAPVTITGAENLCDNTGKLFLWNNNKFTLNADFNNNCLCLKTPNYNLSVIENQIYGNDINNPNITASYELSINPTFVYYSEPYIYAGGYSDEDYVIEKLQEDQLNITDTQNSTESTTNATTTEQSKPTNVTDPTENTANSNLSYSSEVYEINKENSLITNVSNSTTVAEFKKMINCNGDIIVFDKNNSVKTSGYVGSDMTVVFSNNNEKIKFTISVKGDLTGEGNVNTLDINKMFDFLLNKDTPTTAQLSAGDFDNNGALSNKDLLLLERLRLNLTKNK